MFSCAVTTGTETFIAPAAPDDADAIRELLRAAELPHRDFEPHLDHFLVARNAGKIVGVIGAEIVGTDALLRSLVVAPECRKAGLGSQLLAALETAAAAWGVSQWWLLTMTAESFFMARGFRPATRCAAPDRIRQTGQFSGGCDSAAICLTRERRVGS